MSEAIASVIIAAAQSVAKVFVIGGVGYGCVKYPRKAPFLPRGSVGTVARFSFHALTLPLIYSTIAVAVSPQSVGNYWFLIVGGWMVLGVSYGIATLLRCCVSITNHHDFVALRVASTFPNIVALPILIFPSLCEFSVVYEGYAMDYNGGFTATMIEEELVNDADLRRECVAQSNTMIFCYFFAWSLAFWSFGYPQLMNAAKDNNNNNNPNSQDQDSEDTQPTTRTPKSTNHTLESLENLSDEDPSTDDPLVDETAIQGPKGESAEGTEDKDPDTKDLSNDHSPPSFKERIWGTARHFWTAFKQTTTSPGFIAMALAFITACVPPLQKALFEPGGALRFLGSAMEALGTASSPISTIVVASSLVPPSPFPDDTCDGSNDDDDGSGDDDERTRRNDNNINSGPILDEQPGMTDPNFGPYQRPTRRRRDGRVSRFQSLRMSVRSASIRLMQAVPRSTPDMRRLHVWFCMSRLIVTPAVVVGVILALDCSASGVLGSVPNLAKLVIVVNSALPGALIVVVLLKAQEECADTAAAVSKVYLPSYLFSILTIALWCSVGLWITLPDDEGLTVCQRP